MELDRWTQLGLTFLQLLLISSLPREYTVINEACPGAEWNIMCRECCEYDQIECVCPGKKEVMGYTIPCCRNEENECDSCLIHPGCTIFEKCKSCQNGSWGGTLDDFYVKGFCAECRAGWYGGDCMRCGQVLRVPKGQILLESYPLNAHCEWTIHAKPGFIIQLRFVMLSLEFDYMCQYDYVEVRDGDSRDSPIIKRFCGNERPAPIRSMGSSLHIFFHLDGSKNFDGFHAIYEEITACSSSPCFHDGICLHDKAGSYKCACLAGYTGQRCENFLEERNCSDLGGPVNGYKKITGGPGLLNGQSVKIGTVVSFFFNNSYVLSGNEKRTCQQNGEWSGKQPICIKACREPKVSDLVRRRVLPMQVQSRETPLNQVYSSAFSKKKLQGAPTKKPALPFGDLSAGYQRLHTQLQYECLSPFYRCLGSSQRTCLRTGKWSGQSPSCIPICGKIENVISLKTQGTRWPWQEAIYRRTSGVHDGVLHKGVWFLVCSGALVNERTVVVAALCVTDLGKVTVIKTADLKIVLGKFYRDDDRDEKTIQSLRISAIILHPNYDPILLDADIAILKLLDKAGISTCVQPICLAAPRDLSISFQESHLTVAGWNILADVRSPGFKNDTLRSGVVRVVDSLLCEEQHEDHGIPVSVTHNMFCASQDSSAPSDICTAETGGIAAMSFPGRASPEPRWHLVGLVSWSYDKSCSQSLSMAFTKVLPFKDWIERNMK
ncbi:inactive serine protease PAMR1-like isoform 2-T2 [Callospermophilus lateralis]|uniref:inactive serine protease PAMR1-like n=1 Tax=Callospermophilus lateralis TaxID=76772 RepID=UPI0040541567